jgi:DNA-binding protein HU-beta
VTAVRRNESMGKPMTKAKIVETLAEKLDVPKKQSAAFLEALAELAYNEAGNGFTIPGIGKLRVQDRKARVGINPQTKEKIDIPAKRVLRFSIAKAAKDAVLGEK